MERHTRTPLIDGGVVNAPPNTTAKHDFAENPQQGSSGTGMATSGLDNGQTATAEQPYMARDHSTGLTTDTRTTGSKLKESASGAKGLAAAIDGTGEILRGNINAAVDRAVKDKAGEARNNDIAAAGENEMTTGQFSHGTKNREGVIPGADGDRRNNREPLSGHVE